MALNRTKTACWVTPNNSASSSCVWLWSSSSNAFNSLSSIFFGCPERGLSSTLKSSSLKRWNPYMIYQLRQCHHKFRQAISVRASAALFFQLKQKIKISRKYLINTKFNISNTVKIKVFVWNSKRYKLNIISRCLTSLKSLKSVVNQSLWTIHNSWSHL